MDQIRNDQSTEAIEKALTEPSEPVRNPFETIESENVGQELTVRQRKFCELYALDIRFMGNGVQAYLEVYDVNTEKPGWYKTACACASRLLSNAKVFNHVNSLLEANGLNEAFVDKQLLFLLSQQDDKSAKMAAIKEFNRLKKRWAEEGPDGSTRPSTIVVNVVTPSWHIVDSNTIGTDPAIAAAHEMGAIPTDPEAENEAETPSITIQKPV